MRHPGKERSAGTPAERGGEEGIGRLRAVLARLRGPQGCPWDREQTLATLKPCLLEETYELLEVMAGDDKEAHAEELGDVLLQVALQARIREEAGDFDLNDVAERLAEKLVRRHPHVFGDRTAADADEALRNWEGRKRDERDRRGRERAGQEAAPSPSAIDGVPAALPALLRAQRIQARAARAGFDWPGQDGPWRKIAEETEELREAVAGGNRAAMQSEMGDLLFSLVNLCRHLGLDAEESLRASADRFAARFREAERRLRLAGRDPRLCTPAELDAIWEAVKRGDPA